MAILTVICGPMYSEKSSKLVWYVQRALRANKRIEVWIPSIDTRSSGDIKTHSGMSLKDMGVEVQIANEKEDINPLPSTEEVYYDEAQFSGKGFMKTVKCILSRGINVTVAGLDMTAEGETFGPMGDLLARAEVVVKQTAVCFCGQPATMTFCKIKKTGDILVGGDAEYEPRCFRCWDDRS